MARVVAQAQDRHHPESTPAARRPGSIAGILVGRRHIRGRKQVKPSRSHDLHHASWRSSDWRPGRVYFLTLLEPLAGTTGLWPLPPGRPGPATVSQLITTVDLFTAK